MLCPKCGVDAFRVKDSRQHYADKKHRSEFHCIVIRVRECFACGYSQKTPETVEKEKTIYSADCVSTSVE